MGPSVRPQDEGGGPIPSPLYSYSRFVCKTEGVPGAFLLVPNSQEKILHSSNTSKATYKEENVSCSLWDRQEGTKMKSNLNDGGGRVSGKLTKPGEF